MQCYKSRGKLKSGLSGGKVHAFVLSNVTLFASYCQRESKYWRATPGGERGTTRRGRDAGKYPVPSVPELQAGDEQCFLRMFPGKRRKVARIAEKLFVMHTDIRRKLLADLIA